MLDAPKVLDDIVVGNTVVGGTVVGHTLLGDTNFPIIHGSNEKQIYTKEPWILSCFLCFLLCCAMMVAYDCVQCQNGVQFKERFEKAWMQEAYCVGCVA